jgi:PII-like signaling protein
MSDGMKHGVFRTPELAKRLRIYVGESDKHHGVPLYEAVVIKARELHLAGATVLRGPMGFGANSRIHTAKILRLSEDLPIVVEIVDTAEKVATLIPHLEEMVTGGLVTIEDVGILIYSPSEISP